MSDNMSYSTNQYLPPPQYYQQPNIGSPVQPPPRPELAQRKRPKYTRSKTGCMTCRVKKIKCDESKPVCMRCTHGSRECSWPEGVPARKKSNARKDSIDERPSTAGSSGMSESPTPPTREDSPPRRNTLDLSLLPLPSRPSDAFASLHSLGTEHDSIRRPLERASSYTQPSSHMLSLMPETQYTSRYDHTTYLNGQNARGMPAPYRPTLPHQSASHWGHTESLDPYYHGHHAALQERPLVGHTSQMDHSHNRYQ
ncbi:hypothetical protein CPB83DRAFT_861891 [Crepidotus variabilis]|uniref:Zn(2)-C6 fungal-type domain-containing protein n=1 Tax=Crepidotus variabilis TaxID=179855 RepID=A0A9P6E7X3_9AGAR|nr:hypothetical protein CPB83DRAFT_861891 [Crepidotus variabilis]